MHKLIELTGGLLHGVQVQLLRPQRQRQPRRRAPSTRSHPQPPTQLLAPAKMRTPKEEHGTNNK